MRKFRTFFQFTEISRRSGTDSGKTFPYGNDFLKVGQSCPKFDCPPHPVATASRFLRAARYAAVRIVSSFCAASVLSFSMSSGV